MKRRRSYRRLLFVPLFFIMAIILNVMLESISIELNEEQVEIIRRSGETWSFCLL